MKATGFLKQPLLLLTMLCLLLTLFSCDSAKKANVSKREEITTVGNPNTQTETKDVETLKYSEPVLNGTYAVEEQDAAQGSVSYGYSIAEGKKMPKPMDQEDEKVVYQLADKNKETEFNTEQYGTIVENEFRRPVEAPLSTFSIDVDVASYGIIRSKIENRQDVPKDAVRIEEMVNYFTYNYDAPKDNRPFAVQTQLADCPWNAKHKLLQIGIQGKKIPTQNLPASNLVFLVDVSGSMDESNKLPLVQNALRLLVNQLNEKDRVAIVTYAGASGLALPSTPCNRKDDILQSIDNMQAGGSTNGAEGIELAYKTAKENFLPTGNNRVILCTDGDFNVGVTGDGDLVRLIEEKRKQGIFLSVLGFGMGNYKDSKMEQLADKGNGNYAYIDNVFEAKKNLVSQMGATLLCIAKDVKIQVEFNPVKVKGYRLIGYENRLLNAEDFNDDTKDAGEIGAGANVTAIYEITTDDKDDILTKPKVDPLKYQINGGLVTSNDLLTVKIRYKDPNADKSQLLEYPVADKTTAWDNTSNDFRFAVAVAGFGLVLRDSKFKGNLTMDKVRTWADKARGEDKEGYRNEFIKLLDLKKNMI
jgi:Ca-activated chloride channel family protein